MVYGNMGNDFGIGVVFIRNFVIGEKEFYGEFLMNVQGEDVVVGIRILQLIFVLKEIMLEVYQQFVDIVKKFEIYYKDMQDMEFIIERGKFYMFQIRNGKRIVQAVFKIVVDMVEEGFIIKEEVMLKVDFKQFDILFYLIFELDVFKAVKLIVKGFFVLFGAVIGKIYFIVEEVKAVVERGEKKVIFVRIEIFLEDIEGMVAVQGILILRGGMILYAVVVVRGMGKCCVVGCGDIIINEEEKYFIIFDGKVYCEGDWILFDGLIGYVYVGEFLIKELELIGYFVIFM